MVFSLFQRGVLPIGVDLGDSSVKLLQLQHERGSLRVVDAAREPFSTPLSECGDGRREVIASAVRNAIRAHGFIAARCVASLPPSDMLMRTMRTAPIPDQELDSGCRWEAAQRFELDIEDLEAGWLRAGEVVQGDVVRDEILLLAGRRACITSTLDALHEAGLQPIAVDTPFTAVARCFGRSLRRNSDSETVQMVLDVGAATTDVVVIRGNAIAFIKSIPIGGRRLTQAVADALKLDYRAAEDLRRERMSSANGETSSADRRVNRAMFQAVRSYLHDIAEEASLCLRYYSVTFRGARPQRLLLVGGDALEPGLVDVMSDVLKIDVQVGRPLDSIDRSSVNFELERRESPMPQWAVACGLSLRAFEFAKQRRMERAEATTGSRENGERGAA